MSNRDHFRIEIAEVRLAAWQRHSVYVALVAVALTGIAWTISHDMLGLGPNPIERLLLEVHGAASFISVAAFGSVLPYHVRLAWNARRNRRSGAVIAAFLTLLVVTAYALYYAGEDAHDIAKWLHVGIGVAACAAVPGHVWLGRRSRW